MIAVTLGLAKRARAGGGGPRGRRWPSGGGAERHRRRGGGRADADPPARPEAARGGRLLAVRQPRAAGRAGGLRRQADASGSWRWPTSWACWPTRCRSRAASSRWKGAWWGCWCCSACARRRSAIAAVVVYRAISLWLPALIGTVAFVSLRREIVAPAVAGAAAGYGEVDARPLDRFLKFDLSEGLLTDVVGQVRQHPRLFQPDRPVHAGAVDGGRQVALVGAGALIGYSCWLPRRACSKVSEKTSMATWPEYSSMLRPPS